LSVVVAIKEGDTIWMGCDSQVTQGYTKRTLESMKKIWKPEKEKDVLMGVVGAVRDLNILSIEEEWIEELIKMKNEVNYKYIIKKIIPKIFTTLSDSGRLYNKDGVKFIESNIVFAYQDKMFSIHGDGAVMESEDIIVDGSGRRLCLGAWNSIKDKDFSIKEKLVEVVKSACESDLYVNYPIVIMNTKNDEVEIITK
jgi:ATP-dependent protease HslVU (ClpYQ) peptidase subunit